jgi:hypothetical protein
LALATRPTVTSAASAAAVARGAKAGTKEAVRQLRAALNPWVRSSPLAALGCGRCGQVKEAGGAWRARACSGASGNCSWWQGE